MRIIRILGGIRIMRGEVASGGRVASGRRYGLAAATKTWSAVTPRHFGFLPSLVAVPRPSVEQRQPKKKATTSGSTEKNAQDARTLIFCSMKWAAHHLPPTTRTRHCLGSLLI